MRRSPAVYCYTPLPLDLHVLSLPLAFILSQDQTLHCKNCLYFLTFDSSVSLRPASPDFRHTLSLHLRNSMFSRFPEPPPKGAVLRRKRVQRYDLFSNCQIFFRTIFLGCPRMVCRTADCTEKKFLSGPEKGPKNPAKKKKARHFSRFFGYACPIKNGMFAYYVVFLLFMAFSLCAYSVGLSSIYLSHNILQRHSIRDISPYFFLRCLPHSYLFHAPPCPAALSQSTGPRPVHCSMRRQRIRTASIYYL